MALVRYLVSMQLAVNIHAESLPVGIFPEILNTAIIRSETNSFNFVKGSLANRADPDQPPHDVAADQGLYCLLTWFSIKNRKEATI